MKIIKIKFPSGKVGSELLYCMGVYDKEKPLLTQQLASKCFSGQEMELTEKELKQLIKEVYNAIDIKADHVGDGDWSGMNQWHLTRFLAKIQLTQ
jgi:hypothetical protein